MFTLKEFLQSEVKPALGCTEPGAVALAVARACQELPSHAEIAVIRVTVSDGIYKNGMTVGIPGTNGVRGNAVAAAMAAICGKAEYGLQVLQDCGPEAVAQAEKMVAAKQVFVTCHPDKHGVYVEAAVEAPPHRAICIIEDDHSNIVRVTKDDGVVYEKALSNAGGTQNGHFMLEEVRKLTYAELLSLVDQVDAGDVDYLMEGVRLNKEIAEYGFKQDSLTGLGLGKTMKALIEEKKLQDDLGNYIKSYCYAAADARMAGAQLSVMSSAGSGNHGLAAILPIAIVGEKLGKSRFEIAKALAVSHLSTSMVKSKLGRLSAVCGCAVAAGAGAAAGLTYLMGGNIHQCAKAMQTLLANTAGMLCDGAKGSCSLKVGTAGAEAYLAALFALENRGVDFPQGLVADSLEKTTDNMGRLNCEGMRDVDQVMIDILENRS
jgi:L-cysteine desulfidase